LRSAFEFIKTQKLDIQTRYKALMQARAAFKKERSALSESRGADAEQRRIVLQFDQPVVWDDKLAADFWLAGKNNVVARAATNGNQLILDLKEPTTAAAITYLDSGRWSEKRVLRGSNGIAALTFCNVVIEAPR
jgi:hypothetical protein